MHVYMVRSWDLHAQNPRRNIAGEQQSQSAPSNRPESPFPPSPVPSVHLHNATQAGSHARPIWMHFLFESAKQSLRKCACVCAKCGFRPSAVSPAYDCCSQTRQHLDQEIRRQNKETKDNQNCHRLHCGFQPALKLETLAQNPKVQHVNTSARQISSQPFSCSASRNLVCYPPQPSVVSAGPSCAPQLLNTNRHQQRPRGDLHQKIDATSALLHHS